MVGQSFVEAGAVTAFDVIANPIAETYFQCASKPLGEKRKLLALGRLAPEKRFHLALEALAQLEPTFSLDLVGTGPEEARLKKMAETLALGERVRFHGQLFDPSGLMATADLVLMPSATEGLPLVALEALAAQTPILANGVGGFQHCSMKARSQPPVSTAPPTWPNAFAASSKWTDYRRAGRFGPQKKRKSFHRKSSDEKLRNATKPCYLRNCRSSMDVSTIDLVRVCLSGLVALALSLYIAPGIIAAAERYGIVDAPDHPLKVQRKPVAYLGGLVIFIGFVLGLAVTTSFDARVLGLLLAASLVVAVGLVDDLGTLIPRDKLLGQVLASLILVKSGVQLNLAGIPYPFNELVSIFWLVTCMNAFNIVDVSDGLATAAGIVGSAGIGVLALLSNDVQAAVVAFCLFGGCLGFLKYNKEPARMYLGDTGSMMLGTVGRSFFGRAIQSVQPRRRFCYALVPSCHSTFRFGSRGVGPLGGQKNHLPRFNRPLCGATQSRSMAAQPRS